MTKINIPDSLLEKTRKNADTNHCDNDMGRTSSEKEVDAAVGYLTEQLAFVFFKQNGYDPSEPNTTKYDFDVGNAKVEVKGRKTWDREDPDLLVRTKNGLPADIYLHIDIHTENGRSPDSSLSNVSHAEVVGFATKQDVKINGENFSPSGKQSPTKLVPRNYLRLPKDIGSEL